LIVVVLVEHAKPVAASIHYRVAQCLRYIATYLAGAMSESTRRTAQLATVLQAPDAVLLDVRDPQELVLDGSVPGALNFPLSRDLENVAAAGSFGHLSTPIVVFCRSGNRSSYAARALREAGYNNVVNAGSWRQVARALARSSRAY